MKIARQTPQSQNSLLMPCFSISQIQIILIKILNLSVVYQLGFDSSR